MRRRNPPCLNRRRDGGPPPWPSAAAIAQCRKALVARRGLGPDASREEVAALRRADAWVADVDMRCAPPEVVMTRVLDWAAETDGARAG